MERDKEEIPLWAIWAREVSPTGAERALDWKLLTNIEVRDFEQACEKIEWYTIRFGIESRRINIKLPYKSRGRSDRTW